MAEIEFEIGDGIARVHLNRPHVMNAVRAAGWPLIAERLQSAVADASVRVIVFTGAGANFCSGADVNEFRDSLKMTPMERAAHWMKSDQETALLFTLLERAPQTVVVSVRGYAAGGGLGLVGIADLVIASETVKLLPAQINIGAIPDTAVSYSLVQAMGVRRAKQYCLLGDTIDAHTALELDLVNWVVEDSSLEASTEALVRRLAAAPRTASALTKAALNRAHRISLVEHIQQQTLDVGACVVDEDYSRLVQAFFDRR